MRVRFEPSWLGNPGIMVRVHFWAALSWMAPGTLLAWWIIFGIDDMKWAAFAILMVSNYANFVSHWGAYQAARAELEATKVEKEVEHGRG